MQEHQQAPRLGRQGARSSRVVRSRAISTGAAAGEHGWGEAGLEVGGHVVGNAKGAGGVGGGGRLVRPLYVQEMTLCILWMGGTCRFDSCNYPPIPFHLFYPGSVVLWNGERQSGFLTLGLFLFCSFFFGSSLERVG